jgi:hypothetical protein
METKIFQIGFNKCGTTSIAKRLQRLGFETAHHEGGQIALMMEKNRKNGNRLLAGLEHYDAFTDMVYIDNERHIEAFKYFKTLLAENPESKFIYNTRDKSDWLQSCAKHEGFVQRMMSVYNYTDISDVLRHWSEDWDEHFEKAVREIPSDRLLVFDIDKDDAHMIDSFVGVEKDLPNILEAENVTLNQKYLAVVRRVPKTIRRNTPSRLKNLIRSRLI